MSEVENDTKWHLDRKVPLSLIGAVILQTFVFGGVYYVTQYRLASVEERIGKLELSDTASNITDRNNAERLARIETSMVGMKETLNRIDNTLDRLSRPGKVN